MIKDRIYIVPIEVKNTTLLDSLGLYLANTFRKPARILKFDIDIDSAYDPNRNQFNSSCLLAQLIRKPPRDTYRILGVCQFDLFIPILTFVFGEAQLEGKGAIVSLHRLKNEFYGGEYDNHLLMERLLKEATHELGHTHGLYHCYTAGCVMNSSTYVEDIDEKSVLFCRNCKQIVVESKRKN